MKKALLFACASLTCIWASAQVTGRMVIDTSVKGHDINKSMYGIFFEEINHSGDGGLYAELIQNRGFEEHVIPSGTTYANNTVFAPKEIGWNDNTVHNHQFYWDLEGKKYQGWSVESSSCTVAREVVAPDVPLHANTPHAMQLVISDVAPGASARLVNEGYWGIAVAQDERYDLRFYLCSTDYAGNIVAKIADASGNIAASYTFQAIADGTWHEYKATLTSGATVTDGTFCLEFNDPGTVLVDYVSLFPQDTYKGRPNGLRRDIAETLVNLHPAFMRWPGGCIVEGLTLENRVKWKETLGDPMQRRGEYDCWGYRCTWGLGYHEALQFCEDANMDFMFVGNVGMACAGRGADYVSSDADLQPFIDDIRDAIEYAIGDPETNEWAKMRADAGHPQPFSLKYVEIGNENWGAQYAKNFNRAYAQLKVLYPDITFINTMAHYDAAVSQVKATDMLDPHWYQTPDWFYNTPYEFDNIDRGSSPWTIYVGEYACNNQVGSGNLDAALAESAFMMNMERNSDIVTMSSYAPLISNQNRPDWQCNLIWVNNHQVSPRASYYAQKLFADNRPSYNVQSKIATTADRSPYAGRIALGTFTTSAEFRNVKVTSPVDGRVLYQNDLSTETPEWSKGGCSRGAWTFEDGVLKQTSLDQSTYFTMDMYSFGEVCLEVEAKKTGGTEGFLINIGVNDNNIDNSWRFNIGGWGNNGANLEKATGLWGTEMDSRKAFKVENDRWYKIKMVGLNGTIHCYVDDVEYATYTPQLLNTLPGRVNMAAGYDEATGEVVVKVVNANAEPIVTDITLNASNIENVGTVTTLSGPRLYLENSFNNSSLLTPYAEVFEGFAPEFTYTLLPYSLTIFRAKASLAESPVAELPGFAFTDTPRLLKQFDATPYLAAASRLKRTVNRCLNAYTESANDAATLLSAINNAKSTLEAATCTQADLENAFDVLCKAFEVYCQAQMTSDNECTYRLSTPDFSVRSAAGWDGNEPVYGEGVAEFYDRSFGMLQQVDGLPEGKYMVVLQGFYRPGVVGDRSIDNLIATLRANDDTVPLRSMYSTTIPAENMWGAANLFGVSEYTACNYVLTDVTDGNLLIELSKEQMIDRDWTCFNNFRLFRIGDISGIPSVTDDVSGRISPFASVIDLAGRNVGQYRDFDKLTPGIYICSGRKIIRKY